MGGCGLDRSDVERNEATWAADGEFVAANLGFDSDMLTASQQERIYRYYLPIFYWVLKQLKAKASAYDTAAATRRPLVVCHFGSSESMETGPVYEC